MWSHKITMPTNVRLDMHQRQRAITERCLLQQNHYYKITTTKSLLQNRYEGTSLQQNAATNKIASKNTAATKYRYKSMLQQVAVTMFSFQHTPIPLHTKYQYKAYRYNKTPIHHNTISIKYLFNQIPLQQNTSPTKYDTRRY